MSFLNGLSLPGRPWARSLCLFVAVLAAGASVGSLAFVLTHETAALPMPAVKAAASGWRITWTEGFGAFVVVGESIAWHNESGSRLFVMDPGTGEVQEIESGSTEAASLGVSGRYAV